MTPLALTTLEKAEKLRRGSSVRYEDDPYTWAVEQAGYLRSQQWSRLDIEHLADEIEDVARSEARGLRSALSVLLQHLLKWDHQAERRSVSWKVSIRARRRMVSRALKENPGLKSKLVEITGDAYEDGRDAAICETNLPESIFPAACPYGWDEIMTRRIDLPD